MPLERVTDWQQDQDPIEADAIDDADVPTPEESVVERVSKDRRWHIFVIILFLISLGMLIAGAVMLGIGISKNNSNSNGNGTCPAAYAAPIYATVQTTAVSYQQVQNNYQSAVNTVTNQIYGALTSSSFSMLAVSNDPVVTVIGLSNSTNGTGVLAVVGLGYTNLDAPDISVVQQQLTTQTMQPKNVDKINEATSPSQQMCSVVSGYSQEQTTTMAPTTTTAKPSIPTSKTTVTKATVPPTTTAPSPAASTSSSAMGSSTSPITLSSTSTTPTKTASTPAVTSTTSPYTIPTCPSSPTSSPTPSVNPAIRDIVVLIDDSTAVGSSSNYNSIKSWLMSSLYPLWNIGLSTWQSAVVQYAQYEYNILAAIDDENNVGDLIMFTNVSTYFGQRQPSIQKALKSTVSLPGRAGAPRSILLISASSNITDIELAKPYASQLTNAGALIVTMTVGTADGAALGFLSSGTGYTFSNAGYQFSGAEAAQITNALQGNVNQTVSTVATTTSATTSPSSQDFPCHPDVAIIFDTSSAVPSDDEYIKQLDFLANQLSFSWPISPSLMEAEVVRYSTNYNGFIASGAFNYASPKELTAAINSSDAYFAPLSQPSISGALTYLNAHTSNRRDGRTPVTLLITYSNNYADIQSAVGPATSLGDMVIVSMGLSSQYLNILTGNVISGVPYGSGLVSQINSMLCTPSSPNPQTTTAATSPTTTTKTTTTTTTTTTTPAPISCIDCSPAEANILLMLDASPSMTSSMLSTLQTFINTDLLSTWNHAERLALGGFDDYSHFEFMNDFFDLRSIDEYKTLVSAINLMSAPGNLSSVFIRAMNNYHPLQGYGMLKTVIFTSFGNTSDVATALPYAKQLQAKGPVIIVGLNMDGSKVSALSPLSTFSPISWANLSDSTGISAQIDQQLNQAPPTTTPVTTTTTTVITTTGTTPTPDFWADCPRDVILVIDESNALTSSANFETMKTSILNVLLPMWNVNTRRVSVAPYGFTNKSYDLGGDFVMNSASQLESVVKGNLQYQSNAGPSLTSVLRKIAALQTPRGSAATILISASDAKADVNTALPYSQILQQNNGTVITVSIGNQVSGQLIKLASGIDFAISTGGDYAISAEYAEEISWLICMNAPTEATTTGAPPTTTLQPTTTVFPTPYPCTADIAIMVDNSAAFTNYQFTNVMNFISNSLVSTWNVGLNSQTESILVLANAMIGTVDGNWRFQSTADLQTAISSHLDDYYGGQSSLESLLNIFSEHVSVRQNSNLVGLMFVNSSDPSDAYNALQTITALNSSQTTNIIIVGSAGTSPSVLSLLTGNVIVDSPFDNTLVSSINSAICNYAPPLSTPTASPMPTTSVNIVTTTASTTTTTTPPTTTVSAENCPDCIPDMANLLILVDASINQTGHTFSQQKAMIVNLTSTWTHYERVSLAAYASSLDQVISYRSLHRNGQSDFLKILHEMVQTTFNADIAHSLQQASGIQPVALFGVQKTIFLTTTADQNALQKAQNAANTLQGRGQVTVVGVGMADVTALTPLASPGLALSWPNVDNTSAIANDIMATLASSTPTGAPPTGTTIAPTGTAGTQTILSSTASPVVTANCPRDVVLLIDESNSIPDIGSFNKLKTSILNVLLPMWNINSNRVAVAPYGFTNKTYDLGADFLMNSLSQLQTVMNSNLAWQTSSGPSLTNVLRRTITINIPRFSPVYILVSSSDNAADVATAVQFSQELQVKGVVITVGIGSSLSGQLPSLSSGANYSFTTGGDYAIGADVAQQISVALCTNAPPEPTTTIAQVTTTTTQPTTVLPTVFPCTADIALIVDSSSAFSENDFAQVMTFIANTLITNWNVGYESQTESIIVIGNQIIGHTEGNWRFSSTSDLQSKTLSLIGDYYGGPTSIESLLNIFEEHTNHRSGAYLHAILFVNSSDPTDIYNSLTTASNLRNNNNANIIVVGMSGADPNLLGLLSGNVITGQDLNSNLAAMIDNDVCHSVTPKFTPTPFQSTTVMKTTTLPPTTTTTTTRAPTTTVSAENCPDCVPDMANLLILIDVSVNQSSHTFSQQKAMITSLTSTWTHYERVSLAAYASALDQVISYQSLHSNDQSAFSKILNQMTQTSINADIAHSLQQASGIQPVALFGAQKTIFLTTTADPNALQKAQNAANTLQGRGQVTVVGVGMADVTALAPLASPGLALSWSNVDDTAGIVSSIMGTLSSTTGSPATEAAASSSVASTLTQPSRAGSTTASPPPKRGIVLLLDNSNGIPTQENFSQLQAWVNNSLVPGWNPPSNELTIYGYSAWSAISDDPRNDLSDVQLLITYTYNYFPRTSENLASGLRKAPSTWNAFSNVGAYATVLVSAATNPNDTSAAQQYADPLRTNGNILITLNVGSSTDNLATLSSGSGFSFASSTFSPDGDTTAKIVAAVSLPAPSTNSDAAEEDEI